MWRLLIKVGESRWRKKKRTYQLKKVVHSLGKRVESVHILLGKSNEQEFTGRVLPASSVSFPSRWNETVLVREAPHLQWSWRWALVWSFATCLLQPLSLQPLSLPIGSLVVRKVIAEASVLYLPCQFWGSFQCFCLWLLSSTLFVVGFTHLQKAQSR